MESGEKARGEAWHRCGGWRVAARRSLALAAARAPLPFGSCISENSLSATGTVADRELNTFKIPEGLGDLSRRSPQGEDGSFSGDGKILHFPPAAVAGLATGGHQARGKLSPGGALCPPEADLCSWISAFRCSPNSVTPSTMRCAGMSWRDTCTV